MANVLVVVKGGCVVDVLADGYNVNVRILDQDAENETTDMKVEVGSELYNEYMLDLGYAGFHVGDTVVVSDDWQGTIVGFKKENPEAITDGSGILAQVEDEDGDVIDVEIEAIDWN